MPVEKTINRQELLLEEEERLKRLRLIVDSASDKLQHSDLTWDDARRIIEQTKESVLELFPDKEGLFDLIYKSRFYRIIESRSIT